MGSGSALLLWRGLTPSTDADCQLLASKIQILCSNNQKRHSTQKPFITTTVIRHCHRSVENIPALSAKLWHFLCEWEIRDPTSHREKIWTKEPIGYLSFGDIDSSQGGEVIINDCTVSLPRERRKRQNMTWWLDRASLCLSDKTCSRPVDFPFVSIECELRWPYFLIWHPHWGNRDWNSLTHWFDLVVFEWPFMVHNESVCHHWLCIVREESGRFDCSWDDGKVQPCNVANNYF